MYRQQKRYKWPIYLQCQAGGVPGNDLGGTIYNFNYLLTDFSNFTTLNAVYSWVKCNKNFDALYVTDYSNSKWLSFANIVVNAPGSVVFIILNLYP